ncbi:MAG: hypothetical protein ACPG6L_03305 [Nereida ignava]
MKHPIEIDYDTWAYGLPKLRNPAKIKLNHIHGVLPFSGVRNPITASGVSHKVSLTYKTEANGWKRKVGLVESAAELAVAEEALISPQYYDVEFQPVMFPYICPKGQRRSHTIDLRLTYKSGRRVFVFVRNASSLSKPSVKEEIEAIKAAAPANEAHNFIIVDGDSYSRPRRENLRRMHRLVAFEQDPASDEEVFTVAHNLKTLWRMSDLHTHTDLTPNRIFQSCLRLIATKQLAANMDAIICEHSKIWRLD